MSYCWLWSVQTSVWYFHSEMPLRYESLPGCALKDACALLLKQTFAFVTHLLVYHAKCTSLKKKSVKVDFPAAGCKMLLRLQSTYNKVQLDYSSTELAEHPPLLPIPQILSIIISFQVLVQYIYYIHINWLMFNDLNSLYNYTLEFCVQMQIKEKNILQRSFISTIRLMCVVWQQNFKSKFVFRGGEML